MMNAPKDGIYELDGNRFLIRKGDPLPEGAVFDDPDAMPAPEEPKLEERKRPAAPENRTAKAPGEQR